MMAAGATPNTRDAAEFTRMFTEKAGAFAQAWVGSWVAMCWAPWHVSMELLRAGAGLGHGGAMPPGSLWRAWRRQAWSIAGSGLAPVHRTAVANARRLARR